MKAAYRSILAMKMMSHDRNRIVGDGMATDGFKTDGVDRRTSTKVAPGRSPEEGLRYKLKARHALLE